MRIKKMSLSFTRNGTQVFSLPAQSYLQNPTDKDSVLFTPYSLSPDDEWSHIVNFLNFFDRDNEKRYRNMESTLRQDILEKRRRNPDLFAEANQENVKPIVQFFNENFGWHPGEYIMTIKIIGDKISVERKHRFSIFEFESEELKTHVNDYKYGARIYWEPSDGSPGGIFVQIHDEHT